MAIDVDRLCKNCMLEIPDGQTVCPYCGYDPENDGTLSRLEHALPDLTILKGKYLAGPVLDAKESGITYLALDLVSEERVIVEEHEPDQAGMRPETGNAADGSAVTDSFEEYGRFYTIKEYEPETTDSEPDRTDSGSKSPAPKKALDGKGLILAAAAILILLFVLWRVRSARQTSDLSAGAAGSGTEVASTAGTTTSGETAAEAEMTPDEKAEPDASETEPGQDAAEESYENLPTGINLLFDPSVYRGDQDIYSGLMMTREEAAGIPFRFDFTLYGESDYSDGRDLSELGTEDTDYWIEELPDHSGDGPVLEDMVYFSEQGDFRPEKTWSSDSAQPYLTFRGGGQTQAASEGYSSYLYTVTPVRYTVSGSTSIKYHNKQYGESDNGYRRVSVPTEPGQSDVIGYEKDGKMVIRASFYDAGWFSEGLASVNLENGRDHWGYIDESGVVRIPFCLRSAGAFVNGLAPISFTDANETVRYGYINTDGKLVYLLAEELSAQITEASTWNGVQALGPVDENGEFYIGFRRMRTGDENPFMEEVLGGSIENMSSSEEILAYLTENIHSVMEDALSRDVAFSGFLYRVTPDGVIEYNKDEFWIVEMQVPGPNGTMTLLGKIDAVRDLWTDYIVTENYGGRASDITDWMGWTQDMESTQDTDGNYIYRSESCLWSTQYINAVNNAVITVGSPDEGNGMRNASDLTLHDWNKKNGRMVWEVIDDYTYKVFFAD